MKIATWFYSFLVILWFAVGTTDSIAQPCVGCPSVIEGPDGTGGDGGTEDFNGFCSDVEVCDVPSECYTPVDDSLVGHLIGIDNELCDLNEFDLYLDSLYQAGDSLLQYLLGDTTFINEVLIPPGTLDYQCLTCIDSTGTVGLEAILQVIINLLCDAGACGTDCDLYVIDIAEDGEEAVVNLFGGLTLADIDSIRWYSNGGVTINTDPTNQSILYTVTGDGNLWVNVYVTDCPDLIQIIDIGDNDCLDNSVSINIDDEEATAILGGNLSLGDIDSIRWNSSGNVTINTDPTAQSILYTATGDGILWVTVYVTNCPDLSYVVFVNDNDCADNSITINADDEEATVVLGGGLTVGEIDSIRWTSSGSVTISTDPTAQSILYTTTGDGTLSVMVYVTDCPNLVAVVNIDGCAIADYQLNIVTIPFDLTLAYNQATGCTVIDSAAQEFTHTFTANIDSGVWEINLTNFVTGWTDPVALYGATTTANSITINTDNVNSHYWVLRYTVNCRTTWYRFTSNGFNQCSNDFLFELGGQNCITILEANSPDGAISDLVWATNNPNVSFLCTSGNEAVLEAGEGSLVTATATINDCNLVESNAWQTLACAGPCPSPPSVSFNTYQQSPGSNIWMVNADVLPLTVFYDCIPSYWNGDATPGFPAGFCGFYEEGLDNVSQSGAFLQFEVTDDDNTLCFGVQLCCGCGYVSGCIDFPFVQNLTCDSLEVQIKAVDDNTLEAEVSYESMVLPANLPGITYQWTGNPSGIISPPFNQQTVTYNNAISGNVSVEIDYENCEATATTSIPPPCDTTGTDMTIALDSYSNTTDFDLFSMSCTGGNYTIVFQADSAGTYLVSNTLGSEFAIGGTGGSPAATSGPVLAGANYSFTTSSVGDEYVLVIKFEQTNGQYVIKQLTIDPSVSCATANHTNAVSLTTIRRSGGTRTATVSVTGGVGLTPITYTWSDSDPSGNLNFPSGNTGQIVNFTGCIGTLQVTASTNCGDLLETLEVDFCGVGDCTNPTLNISTTPFGTNGYYVFADVQLNGNLVTNYPSPDWWFATNATIDTTNNTWAFITVTDSVNQVCFGDTPVEVIDTECGPLEACVTFPFDPCLADGTGGMVINTVALTHAADCGCNGEAQFVIAGGEAPYTIVAVNNAEFVGSPFEVYPTNEDVTDPVCPIASVTGEGTIALPFIVGLLEGYNDTGSAGMLYQVVVEDANGCQTTSPFDIELDCDNQLKIDIACTVEADYCTSVLPSINTKISPYSTAGLGGTEWTFTSNVTEVSSYVIDTLGGSISNITHYMNNSADLTNAAGIDPDTTQTGTSSLATFTMTNAVDSVNYHASIKFTYNGHVLTIFSDTISNLPNPNLPAHNSTKSNITNWTCTDALAGRVCVTATGNDELVNSAACIDDDELEYSYDATNWFPAANFCYFPDDTYDTLYVQREVSFFPSSAVGYCRQVAGLWQVVLPADTAYTCDADSIVVTAQGGDAITLFEVGDYGVLPEIFPADYSVFDKKEEDIAQLAKQVRHLKYLFLLMIIGILVVWFFTKKS